MRTARGPRARRRPHQGPARRGGRLRSRLLSVWAVIVLLYLFTPIFVVVAFSFNDPQSPTNYVWRRFSLDAWTDPFKFPKMRDAFFLSLRVASVATLAATALGTLMALALVKYRFRAKGIVNTFLVLPLTMPEVVLGFSLLTLFVGVNWSRGFGTIVVAHVMFCMSYVATTVKARIRGFDWRLEEAAADLGATPWRTFRTITLPLIAPGVAAAALLCFALSMDDFIITHLNSGLRPTFPVYVWNLKRSSTPPEINVFASAVLLFSVAVALAGIALQRRRSPERF